MKYISILIVMLALICPSQYYSQKKSKEYSLKVNDINAVVKNGKTTWIVKTTLTNRTRDTLYYFSYTGCDAAFYGVNKLFHKSQIRNDTLIDDGNSLSIDLQGCGAAEQMVISVPPSGKRMVNLELVAYKPLTSPIHFFISLSLYKAKNKYEKIPPDDLRQRREKERRASVHSKSLKIKPPAATTLH